IGLYCAQHRSCEERRSMGKMVRHGGFTRVELLLDGAGGPLDDMKKCQRFVAKSLKKNQMRVVRLTRVPYGAHPCGYILNWTLEESFVVIETWPEIRRVKVVVDLCDYKRNNHRRCVRIANGIVRLYRRRGVTISRETKRDPGVLVGQEALAKLLEKY